MGSFNTFVSLTTISAAQVNENFDQVRGFENIGMVLSSGVFRMVQADGTDFTSTVYGQIHMPSAVTEGQTVSLKVQSTNHFFEDANGSSDIVGEEFGCTSGVAWGNDRPFYLYAINGDDNGDDTTTGLAFGISPDPTLTLSPATATMGYHGNPATGQTNGAMFLLSATDKTSTHALKPCLRLGGFRMQMSTSDDWSIQTLSWSAGDGLRADPFVMKKFTMPTGQNGADSGQFYTGASGNGPTWGTPANIEYYYYVGLDGFITVVYATQNAGNVTNGSAAVNFQLVLPYKHHELQLVYPSAGLVRATAATSYATAVVEIYSVTPTLVRLLSDANVSVQYNDFSSAGDDVSLMFKFRGFGNG